LVLGFKCHFCELQNTFCNNNYNEEITLATMGPMVPILQKKENDTGSNTCKQHKNNNKKFSTLIYITFKCKYYYYFLRQKMCRLDTMNHISTFMTHIYDRLCGLMVRVLGYRSGGPGSIPGTTMFSEERKKKKKGKQVVGLERGPLSLVSTTEELFDRKVAAPV
jgi:hypothetical protein